MTTVTFTRPTPAQVTGLSITSTTSSAILKWDQSADATTYEVYRATTNSVGSASLIATIQANAYTDSSVNPAVEYFYWVRAKNDSGDVGAFSAYSGPASNFLLGSNFNSLKILTQGAWTYSGDGFSVANNVSTLEVNINYTPSGGSPTSTGWVSSTAAISQIGSTGTLWAIVAGGTSGATVSIPDSTVAAMRNSKNLVWTIPAGVPSTATVTGIQVRINGSITSGRSSPTASAPTSVRFAQVSGDSATTIGVPKSFTYTANNTPEAKTVGTTTDVWSMSSAGTGAPYNLSGVQSVSDVSAIYRTVMQVSSYMTAGQTSGRYGFVSGYQAVLDTTGSTTLPLAILYIDPADYPAVAGTGAYLRIRVTGSTNDTAPGVSFTFGLHPVSRSASSGGASACQYVIGSAVSGSTPATWVTPSSDTTANIVGSDFAIPTAGYYCLGVNNSGIIATSAHLNFTATLQLHNA